LEKLKCSCLKKPYCAVAAAGDEQAIGGIVVERSLGPIQIRNRVQLLAGLHIDTSRVWFSIAVAKRRWPFTSTPSSRRWYGGRIDHRDRSGLSIVAATNIDTSGRHVVAQVIGAPLEINRRYLIVELAVIDGDFASATGHEKLVCLGEKAIP
jgi:hypothetical protein